LKIYYNEAGFEIGEKFAANLELLTEENAYNYAAYLLADNNGNSVQVAKYAGLDRVDLQESNEYGYSCLVKTCKQVLDRLEVENRTANKITPRERISHSLWNRVALREAVINAIIHNDYVSDCVPKFEIFSDRLEITSAGFVHPGEERVNFFAGYSIPKNKIFMRIFKDLKMVEYLGSGMPRILKAYPKESYIFSSHFIRMVLPISKEALELEREVAVSQGGVLGKTPVKSSQKSSQKGSQKSSQKIIAAMKENNTITIEELAARLKITDRAIKKSIAHLKDAGVIKRVGPDKGGYWEVVENKNDR
jgi:predicted HTH transcriptional regulator